MIEIMSFRLPAGADEAVAVACGVAKCRS